MPDKMRACIDELIDCAALWAGGDDAPAQWRGGYVAAVRMMRAAPDLVAAVEAFVRDRATCPTANGKDLAAWDQMRAALAKARGEGEPCT